MFMMLMMLFLVFSNRIVESILSYYFAKATTGAQGPCFSFSQNTFHFFSYSYREFCKPIVSILLTSFSGLSHCL